MANPEDKSVDGATHELLEKAEADGVLTAFERAATTRPCPIGGEGSCCKLCSMGPCRLPSPKRKAETAEEKDARRGVCGATIETIAARNFVRMIAAGTSAHSDHGRSVAETFLRAAEGEGSDFQIVDEQKLLQVALDFGVELEGKTTQEIAIEVGETAVGEFGKREGTLRFLRRAPLKRQQIWEEQQVMPRSIDREVVECLHRTAMGVDLDYKHLFQQASRTALADGWGGSMLATELQDIMLGTPVPVTGNVNLGILREDAVNIIVHGHEPLLPEMLVVATRDKELLELAKSKGSNGIQLGGICCSANEILMRHGVPLAGNMLQQEVAVVSGAVEAMVVDVQCIMQSLPKVAECYHTEIITTSEKAKVPGAIHIEADEANPLAAAKEIVRRAIENYPNRMASKVNIPAHTVDLVAGFSHETINYMLGGLFRASYRPLNDNIINGRIRGVAGVVGCTNPRVKHEDVHTRLVKRLIENDVLVVQTGCAAMACAKLGLMAPEAGATQAGSGLAEVCETVGIPPVLHMGSCVDNSRILMAATAMVKEGGLGDDISDLPAAGAAPEWMSEKAIAIGHYFVTSGVYTVFGVTWPTLGSEDVTQWLFDGIGDVYGGMWAFEPDPDKMADLMIAHIDKKRKALGLDKSQERVLYDMDMRRELDAV
ncbi:MAG: anaerobic carbon-monoxide dehydrogenase catalytic subunit [Candidatus Latescibacteria bacterium]|nr:anaerobic carbon-monoxide dehydrogenase catalytic subunit [Candidatus Latescibacterota bacterium]